jgi:hypothetical protein
VSLNSSTELAVVAADGRLFHSRKDLGKKEFRYRDERHILPPRITQTDSQKVSLRW